MEGLTLDRYNELVQTEGRHRLLLDLLMDSMYVSYDGDPNIFTKDVLKLLRFFAPMQFEEKVKQLRKEKEDA